MPEQEKRLRELCEENHIEIYRIYMDIDDEGIIRDVKFKTFGCGAAVATSSMATELVKEKNIKK